MKANLMMITPDMAKKILDEKNVGNRPMSEKHVIKLAKEMERGAWKINGDTICMNEDRLIDGQHRLAAVVLSGVTIQTFVIDGVPSDVFDTKDVGKRRSAGDVLGIRGESNSTRLAAALIMIDKCLTGRAMTGANYSNTEVEELLEKYPDARAALRTNIRARGLILPAVLDACYYLFSKKDPILAEEFVEKIIKGSGLVEGSPWYLLRERLLANASSKAKMSRGYMMALCIKAWNHARAGNEQLRFLRFRTEGENAEQFPAVL